MSSQSTLNLLLIIAAIPVLLFGQSAAPELKPDSQDFRNNYGTWITGKPYSVRFWRDGGANCQALNANLSQLPAGFTWTPGPAADGTLTGTFGAPGNYKFGLSVTCPLGNASLLYDIKVVSPMSMMPGPYLALGNVGAVYAAFLRKNGVKPFNLVVSSGAVPPGLEWDADSGVLVGTPTGTGTYTFTANLTDRMSTSGSGSYTLIVGPPGDFYTSTNRIDFAAMVGGTAQDYPLGVATGDLTVVNYAVASDAAWLSTNKAGGTTPSELTVNVDPSGLAKGTYQGHLHLTPDGGKPAASVTVELVVKDPVPILAAAPDRVQVDVLPDVDAPRQFQIDFQAWNAGAGTLNATAAAWSGLGPVQWLGVQPAQFSATPGQTQPLTVTIDARRLEPGSYRGSITVQAPNALKSIPVLLVVPKTQYVPILKLSNSSWRIGPNWSLMEDHFDWDNAYVLVSNEDSHTSFDFTAALDGFDTRAYVVPTSGHLGPWPAQAELNFKFNNFQLGTGHKEGLLTITAPGAKNSPAHAKIQMDITAAGEVKGSATSIDVQPVDALVNLPAGSTSAFTAQIQITNSSNVPLTYRVVPDQPDAVVLDAPVGTVDRSSPVKVTATVTPTRLDPDKDYMRFAVMADSIVGGATRYLVPEIVITPAKNTSSSRADGRLLGAAACSPAKLVLAAAAPVGAFRKPADEPVKVRAVVVNDCGAPVGDATVTATFSNGDGSLSLPLVDAAKGIYEATWIPGATAPSLSITMFANKSGLTTATRSVFGSVIEDAGGPVIYNGGVVNAVKSVAGDPAAPGGIVAIYGRNLANVTEQAAAVPLPRTLAGTKVLIGGIEAPLYYASPGQINAQVPAELTPDSPYSVVVLRGDRISTPKPLQTVKLDPGIISFADGRIIAQHQADYSLVTSTAPAKPGEIVFFYLVSMGPTTTPVGTGEGAPISPLAWTSTLPSITIGGTAVEPLWSGLVPTAVGLYQIACAVPTTAPSGELEVILAQDGVPANRVTLTVAR